MSMFSINFLTIGSLRGNGLDEDRCGHEEDLFLPLAMKIRSEKSHLAEHAVAIVVADICSQMTNKIKSANDNEGTWQV